MKHLRHLPLVQPQRGQALVELTVGITMVMVLLAGLIDVAPALMNAGQVSQAAREGVDYGHISPTDSAGIRARVRNAAPLLTLADSDITIECFHAITSASRACSATSFGDSIRVTVSTTYVPKIVVLSELVGGSFNLTRSASSLIY